MKSNDKKKEIVLSANTCWYLVNFRLNTIKCFQKLGYSVHIFSTFDDSTKTLEALGCTFHNLNLKSTRISLINELFSLFRFIILLKNLNPGLIFNFTPKSNIYGSLAARITNVVSINNISGLGSLFTKNNLFSICIKVLYRLSQSHAQIIFFQNDEDMNFFISNKIITKTKAKRIPGSGVDLTRFKISPSENDGVVRFVLATRLIYDKGVLQYAEAAKILRNKYGNKVEFVLMGFQDLENPSSIKENEIKTWQKQKVLKFMGSSNSMEKALKKYDCVVLPSFYKEGVPKILLEAASMAKPIVTTDNTGCRDAVEDNVNGYLCLIKSTESLVNKLEKIINLGHKGRIDMGLKGRIKMEKEFDERIVLDSYREVLTEWFPN